MFFWVGFLDGTTRVVRCVPLVDGTLECFLDLFRLVIKEQQAKEIVDWRYVEPRYRIERDNILRIAWPENST